MPRAVTRSSTSVASTRRAKAPAAKKVISKRASAQPKKVAKKSPATTKAVKKEPVRPKKTALTREDRALAKTLDLCLILDCTGSMSSWI